MTDPGEDELWLKDGISHFWLTVAPDSDSFHTDWEIAVVPNTLKPLETIQIDSSDSDGETTMTVLETGRKYLIEAEGTYSYEKGIGKARKQYILNKRTPTFYH